MLLQESYFIFHGYKWTLEFNNKHRKSNQIIYIKLIDFCCQAQGNARCWKHPPPIRLTLHWGRDGTSSRFVLIERLTINRHWHAAMASFQIHLVARGDNCSKVLKRKNLKCSAQFPNLLTVRLARSKNVQHEERDCPKQMILGSRTLVLCCVEPCPFF